MRRASLVDAVAYVRASLGRNLKAAREHAGLTQAELARRVRTSRSTVGRAEAGKTTVAEAYVRRVLKVCGLPPDWKA